MNDYRMSVAENDRQDRELLNWLINNNVKIISPGCESDKFSFYAYVELFCYISIFQIFYIYIPEEQEINLPGNLDTAMEKIISENPDKNYPTVKYIIESLEKNYQQEIVIPLKKAYDLNGQKFLTKYYEEAAKVEYEIEKGL